MEEENRKKNFLIKILAASLAVLIFFFWMINLRNVWQINKLKNQTNTDNLKFSELKEEINNSLDDVNERLNDQKQQERFVQDVNGLLNDVMEEAEKTSSSTEEFSDLATSTMATSSEITSSTTVEIKKSNCPPYINCMPSIGEARPCEIPVGCEEITQIAY